MSHSRLSSSSRNMILRIWAMCVTATLICLVAHTFFQTQIFGASLRRTNISPGQLLNCTVRSFTQSAAVDDNHPSQSEGDLGEETIIIYNRVPKTGSTSLENVIYQLSIANNFHSIHFLTTRFIRILGLADQRKFIMNITNWQERKPALYHGHLAYIDFSRFGVKKLPIYINMVREPLSRMISHYYFLRYGDNFVPSKIRRKAHDPTTFDECVAKDGEDCGPYKVWVQIPFFCGHAAECAKPGSEWALEEAKRNLVHHYLVVGVTERLPEFLAVLEAALPRFFQGASRVYALGSTTHLRQTTQKVAPLEETLQKMERSQAYRMEREFYQFAVNQFEFFMMHTIDQTKSQQFYTLSKIFSFQDSANNKNRPV